MTAHPKKDVMLPLLLFAEGAARMLEAEPLTHVTVSAGWPVNRVLFKKSKLASPEHKLMNGRGAQGQVVEFDIEGLGTGALVSLNTDTIHIKKDGVNVASFHAVIMVWLTDSDGNLYEEEMRMVIAPTRVTAAICHRA